MVWCRRGHLVQKGMPARMAPEILSKKAWQKDRLMSMGQWLALRKRVTDQVEEFGWQLCHKAAADLDLPVDQVCFARRLHH